MLSSGKNALCHDRENHDGEILGFALLTFISTLPMGNPTTCPRISYSCVSEFMIGSINASVWDLEGCDGDRVSSAGATGRQGHGDVGVWGTCGGRMHCPGALGSPARTWHAVGQAAAASSWHWDHDFLPCCVLEIKSWRGTLLLHTFQRFCKHLIPIPSPFLIEIPGVVSISCCGSRVSAPLESEGRGQHGDDWERDHVYLPF